MSAKYNPVVGNWYKVEEEQLFKVVAIDEEDSFVEIQYFGGEIDEMDFEVWNSLNLETVPQPEDWSGPFDQMEADDLGYTDRPAGPGAKSLSVEELE